MDLQASGGLYLAFKNFQDEYARAQTECTTKEKRIRQDFMKEIEKRFRDNGICSRIERSCSSLDGTRVGVSYTDDEDLEPDVLLVIDKHESDLDVLEDKARPGYAWLKMKRGSQRSPELNKVLKYWNFLGYIFARDLYVDPNKTIDVFIGELQKTIHDSDQMKGKVVLHRRGPVIQMDVYPDRGVILWGPCLFSVDLVPAYEVGSVLYVSKPSKGDIPNRMTWRRSFSTREKQNLYDGAKCVLFALKVLRNREPGFTPLTSYHLKTVLFYEMDDEIDWSDQVLVLRFLGVLRRLEISLAYKSLPHYFNEINLLSSMSTQFLRNMHDRIKRIRSSEIELVEILRSSRSSLPTAAAAAKDT